MADHGNAIGGVADIQFPHVGTEAGGEFEGGQGVFLCILTGSAVGNDHRAAKPARRFAICIKRPSQRLDFPEK